MSTVKAINFQHPSASAANITLASDGTVTGGIPSPNRNLLYNGAMQVSQRGTSTASITAAGYYTADRWSLSGAGTVVGTWTQTIENDAPTGSGFRRSLKMLVTTAKANLAAGDNNSIGQALEGQDVQRIAKGTASSKKLTVSFWVKSNVTGTYTAYLYDHDNSRFVSAAYTISASATWEKKTITFPADTTGALDNDNAASLSINFNLLAGTNFTSGTLGTTWAAWTAANSAVGQTNLAAATNNYWQVTGVQLETGDVATDFEFKSYGQELLECQRYYYLHASGDQKSIGMGVNITTAAAYATPVFPVSMRTAPSVVAVSGTNYYSFARDGWMDEFNSLLTNRVNNTVAEIYNDSQISGTIGQAGLFRTNNAAASIAFSAEL